MTTYEHKNDPPMSRPDIETEIHLLKKYIEGVHLRFYQSDFEQYFASIDLQELSEENFRLGITSTHIKSFVSEAENLQYAYEQNIAVLSIAIKFAAMHHSAERPDHAWFWLFTANKSRGILTQIDHYNYLEERLSERSKSARHAALARHKNTIALKTKVLQILSEHKPEGGWRNFKTAMHTIKSEIELAINELGITEIHAGKKNQRNADTVIDLFYKWRHNDPEFKKESNQFVKTSRKLRESIRIPRKPAGSDQESLQAALQLFARPIHG